MSQASRRHAGRAERVRAQVARFIVVDALAGIYWPDGREFSALGDSDYVRAILGAAVRFDVHAAREAAQALVALEVEQAVFEDWCRARGKGPENREPGAFGVRSPWCERCGGEWSWTCPAHEGGGACKFAAGLRGVRGGWPGNLAREYAWDRCPNKCEPAQTLNGLTPRGSTTLADGSVSRSYTVTPGQWTRVKPDGSTCSCVNGRVRHGDRDPRASMGRRLAKLGRAVLRALGGQPSECRSCVPAGATIDEALAAIRLAGRGTVLWVKFEDWIRLRMTHANIQRDMTAAELLINYATPLDVDIRPTREPCPDCRGTGHLRGVLPPIEWAPVVRRKVSDATAQLDHVQRWDGDCWVDRAAGLMPFGWGRLLQAMPGDAEPELHATWRSVPRGEHRLCPRAEKTKRVQPNGRLVKLRDQQRGYMRTSVTSEGAPDGCLAPVEDHSRWPRWRRGELRHAEQRRERQLRAQMAEYEDRGWVDPDASPPDVVFDLA